MILTLLKQEIATRGRRGSVPRYPRHCEFSSRHCKRGVASRLAFICLLRGKGSQAMEEERWWLPPELWCLIFSFLSPHELLTSSLVIIASFLPLTLPWWLISSHPRCRFARSGTNCTKRTTCGMVFVITSLSSFFPLINLGKTTSWKLVPNSITSTRLSLLLWSSPQTPSDEETHFLACMAFQRFSNSSFTRGTLPSDWTRRRGCGGSQSLHAWRTNHSRCWRS